MQLLKENGEYNLIDEVVKNKIDIVGMGPGYEEMMTGQAIRALEEADVIVGYTVYLKLLSKR